MSKQKRNETIDVLRGIAILLMIMIHTNAYHLSNKLANVLWNTSQFVVVTFIFCSGYLYFQKSLRSDISPISLTYIAKRVTRLFIPYYFFLVFYAALLAITKPNAVTSSFITKSLIVVGGVDLSWLVLLFSYIMILLPIIDWLSKKSRILFYTYFLVSFGSSIYFLFFKSPVFFRYIMWLPWSLVIYFSWYVAKFERNKKALLQLCVASIAAFLFAATILKLQDKSLVHFQNKYPPNLFHISYGVFMTLLIYIILEKTGGLLESAQKTINFFSYYSYPIFFIHFFILFAIDAFFSARSFHWVVLFAIVTGLTVITQKGLNKVTSARY